MRRTNSLGVGAIFITGGGTEKGEKVTITGGGVGKVGRVARIRRRRRRILGGRIPRRLFEPGDVGVSLGGRDTLAVEKVESTFLVVRKAV